MMFDGEHKVIPIKGIARAGADSLCEDGAMNEVIGLEYKDGSYVPYSGKITNPSTLPMHEDIQEIYVHKTSSGDNVILKIGGLLFWDEKEEFDKGFKEDLGGFDEIVTDGEAKDVEFIGNVMCISTDNKTQKYIFIDGQYQDYEFVASQLPRIGLQVTLGIPNSDDSIGKQLLYYKSAAKGSLFTLTESIQPQLSKVLGSIREEGGLTGYFLACLAYRLTTGDIVAATAPILLARPMNKNNNKISDINSEFIVTDKTSLYYDESTLLVGSYHKDWTKVEFDLLWNNGYIQTGSEKPINGFYQQNNKNYSAGNIIGSAPLLYATANRFDFEEPYDFVETCATSNKLQYAIRQHSKNSVLSDLVSSVCVFISEEISPYKDFSKGDIEDTLIKGAEFNYLNIEGSMPPFFSTANSYFPVLKTTTEIEKDVSNIRNLYKIAEIAYADIKDLETNEWIDIDTKGLLGDTLLTLESMPISAFSNDTYYGGELDSYNQRLHMYNYNKRLFEGYSIHDFTQIGGLGQFNNTQYDYADEAYIKVYGKNNYGKYSVVRRISTIEEGIESASIPFRWNPILSYPDKNAYRMEIYYRKDNKWFGTGINLKQSASGGYAYNMLNSEPFVSYIDASRMFQELDSAPDVSSTNNVIFNDNQLRVSDTYNPNYFPPANTYTIGNGSIIGIASLSISLSQDTFGQYPLLVFCTDGIYSMGVDTTGTGVYNNIAPFSREVCINRNTICEIDGAVLFASSKGLMIATAQGVDEFIPTLNGEPKHLPQDDKTTNGLGLALYKEAINHELAVQLTGCISKDDFIDFLSDSKTVVTYASEKNNIVVYNPSKPYCYWIDIPTRNTTKLPVGIKMDNNNYPNEEYVTAENRIMMFKHLSAEGDVQCVLQSRPIKLGGKHTSHIRVVARGYFNSADAGKYAVMLVLGSYDGVNWQPLGNMQKPFAGGFHDLGCVVDRVSCEYLMVVVSGSLSSNSHIDGIELTKENKYINKLK